MSDDWSPPEALDSEPPHRDRHTAAIVIAVVVLLLIAGGVVRIATHKSSQDGSSSAVGATTPSPSPSQSAGPDTQESPPLATPSPTPSGTNLGPVTSTTPGLVAAYRQAMTRARHAGSVHSVTTTSATQQGQTLNVVFDDRDGATSGSQKITFNGGVGQVRVVGKDTYLIGSAQVLAGFFGTTANAALADNGRWIHLIKGYRGYSSVTVNVTLASSLDEIELAGPLIKVAPQLKEGVQAYGIRGHIAGASGSLFQATLWVAVSGKQLPVEFDEIGPDQETTVDKFSDWGAKVAVGRPANPVDGKHAFPASGAGSGSGGGGAGGTGGGVPV